MHDQPSEANLQAGCPPSYGSITQLTSSVRRIKDDPSWPKLFEITKDILSNQSHTSSGDCEHFDLCFIINP